ncbi:MAG: GtrA family protein [Minisyncoccia bacterium]|jgi:putative flippase GtrA
MKRSDWWAIAIIGAAVGLLSQPILANVAGSFHVDLTLAVRVAIFVGFTILAPLALFVLYLLGKLVPVLYQFGKFAAVGVLNTFVDIGVLNLEILALGTPAAWPYRIMKTISFLAATTNSFLWNKFWTFGSREPASSSETIKFYLVAVGGFLLNVGVASYVFSGIAAPASISPNLWANIGALAGVAAAFLWDFLGYKYIVFKKPAERV